MKNAVPAIVAVAVIAVVVVVARVSRPPRDDADAPEDRAKLATPNGGGDQGGDGNGKADPDGNGKADPDGNGGSVIIEEWDESARITLEAEGFAFDDVWKVKSSGECSGGKYACVPENSDRTELNPRWKTTDGKPIPWEEEKNYRGVKLVHNGVGVLDFDVETAGKYAVWMRVRWLHGCANSVGFSVDDGPEIMVSDGNYKPAPRWHWNGLQGDDDARIALTKGSHRLTLYNREDGGEIDKILLTTDEVVPQGME